MNRKFTVCRMACSFISPQIALNIQGKDNHGISEGSLSSPSYGSLPFHTSNPFRRNRQTISRTSGIFFQCSLAYPSFVITTLTPSVFPPRGGLSFVTFTVTLLMLLNFAHRESTMRPATCSSRFDDTVISSFTVSYTLR